MTALPKHPGMTFKQRVSLTVKTTLRSLIADRKRAMAGLAAVIIAVIMLSLLKEMGKGEQQNDYMVEIPNGRDTSISSDKVSAYSQAEQEEKTKDASLTLGGFYNLMTDYKTSDSSDTLSVDSSATHGKEKDHAGTGSSAFHGSMAAHKEITRTIGGFGQHNADIPDHEKEELRRQVASLQARLDMIENGGDGTAGRQMELMEQSFRMASKYFPAGTGVDHNTTAHPDDAGAVQTATGARHLESAIPYRLSEVSCLTRGDETQVKYPRHEGFITVTDRNTEPPKIRNSISAVVHEDITITDGGRIRLRLAEAMQVGQHVITGGHLLYGTAKWRNERLEVTIASIEYQGNILQVGLEVYDVDGQKGINLPERSGNRASAEIMSGMAADTGGGIRIGGSVMGELGSQVGRGIIRGVSGYAADRLGRVKIHLKAGYRLLLIPQKNGSTDIPIRSMN